MTDVLKHNRDAWTRESEKGNKWTVPVSSETTAKAKTGGWQLLLMPGIPVPREWFGPVKGKDILCLASGGGQQGPVLAAAGARVTVLDNCPAQLEKDIYVAQRDSLTLEIELGDMRDLSRFADNSFDIIFHPVSNCFTDNVDAVWKECFRVLRPRGRLLAGFANPVIYIFDQDKWDSEGKLEVRNKIPYSDVAQLPRAELERKIRDRETLEYGHSLDTQIGGQLKAGFVICGFYEDRAADILDTYISTFIATLAAKP